ncbi:hypothetical protein KIW84_056148 [Lathyrus oleraceus]|uniref:Retrotransposon gag domain-containing protein n=1 Tax=Pisum sativum TaxID=3888 RepID=A0A9D4X0F5_PEA|nr:hypothetical protein KIW84_056148 [Pisum sativum]
MWDVVKETYSNVDNTSVIFEIKSILHDLRQDDRSVIEYFNTLNRHWQQLDVYDEVEWSCTEDKKKYKELVEKDRVYKFLLGLNTELDEVRGRILGTKPLPKIREAFLEIRREESRRKVMLGKSSAVPSIEGSAMAARGDQRSFQKKTRPWCDHCKKPGHAKETCWIIHGKPSELKWTKNWDSMGNTTEVNSHSSPFNKEQMEALQKMLQQTIEASKPTPEPNENATETAEPTHGPEETTLENVKEIAVETTTPTTETAPENNVKVYSRKSKKGIESCTAPRQNQETSKTLENDVPSGNTAPNSVNVDDINIPIALRKNTN